METINVICPNCQWVLVIDRRDGKIIEKRKPIIEETTGDRFKDAYIKTQKRGEVADQKVEDAKAREKGKMERLDKYFKDSLKKSEKKPPEKPVNPMDLD